jgi:hypothetical protein
LYQCCSARRGSPDGADELALLGTLPDVEVVAWFGRAETAVRTKRIRRGIPRYATGGEGRTSHERACWRIEGVWPIPEAEEADTSRHGHGAEM